MEQQLGNIKLKMDEKKSHDDMEVYKCPRLKCPEVFFNYQDLQSHKVLAHGDLPKFFKKDSLMGNGGFSMAKVKRLNMYSTKYAINTYLTMLKLFMAGSGKKQNKTTEDGTRRVRS